MTRRFGKLDVPSLSEILHENLHVVVFCSSLPVELGYMTSFRPMQFQPLPFQPGDCSIRRTRINLATMV